MKREAVIVGIFGLSLGLLVAWGVWNFRGVTKPTSTPTPTFTPPPTTATQPPTTGLTVNLPEEETLTNQDSATVSGKTLAGTTVVVSSPIGDKVVEADSEGNFQTQVDLEEGENEITVTAYLPDGRTEEQTRTVIFSKESP